MKEQKLMGDYGSLENTFPTEDHLNLLFFVFLAQQTLNKPG